MKRLCYLGILKEGFSAYSSSVMLLSTKVMKDKRVVTDFRHLNLRIAKKQLSLSIIKRYVLRLSSSQCEVLSVIRSKRCFSLLETLRKLKIDIVEFYNTLVALHISIKKWD